MSEDVRQRIREILDSARKAWSEPETQAYWAKHRAAVADADRYYAEKAARDVLVASGIHGEHWPHLPNPRDTEAVGLVRAFLGAQGPKSGILVLAGEHGKGKSFAAAWAVYSLGGEVVQSGELTKESNFNTGFWYGLQERRLLAIDDLGKEQRDKSGWFDSNFFQVIDGRLGAGKKTIITTNLAGKAFMERYAAGALVSLERRFVEHGRFESVGAKP